MTLLSAGLLACSDDGKSADDGTSEGSDGGSSVSDGGSDGGAGTGGGGPDGGTDTGDGGTGGGSGTGDPGPPPDCEPLPPAEEPTVIAGPNDDLAQVVRDAATGTTILLEDGNYDLSESDMLHFATPGVALRSASGNRDAVVLDGGYSLGEIALVSASDITIAEITLQRAYYHPIHVTGRSDANIENTLIYNVKVIDPGQQAIKINASYEGFYVDRGTVACSHIELTDAGRAEIRDNCYTGGIDAHSAWGWHVYLNYFEGFWCDAGLSEHAVHFWVTGRDTLVERNVIVDCARGVGFGLGEYGNGNERQYDDDPCPDADYLGHVDGIIRNNTVFAARPELFASGSGFDSGVSLDQACGAQVFHNTVVSLELPFTSIEYRWRNTDAQIKNNLVTHQIMERDGATAELEGNLVDAPLSHFIDGEGGNLHLVAGSPAIDAGVPGLVDDDIDGDPRDDSPDVGADEWVQ
jgi:hypothetical protein